MEPSEDIAAKMNAWNATFEELELQCQAADSMIRLETIDPSRSMNVDHVDLRDRVNAVAGRQIVFRT